tara:strand:+ start:4290 stop:4805 length:516 start_codon:yes stop_codon:yes gene_type:complete
MPTDPPTHVSPEPVKAKDIHDKARDFVLLREDYEDAQAQVKTLRAQLDDAEAHLLEEMADEGAGSLDVITSDGVRVKLALSNKIFARRQKDAEAHDMHALLRKLGFSEIIKESVNASTLAGVVREMAEELKVRHGTTDEIVEALREELGEEFIRLVNVQSKYALSVRRTIS